MKSIYLNKETITRLSHNEFLTYVALKTYLDKHIIVAKNPDRIATYITIDILVYALFDTFNTEQVTRSFKDNMKMGLEGLIAHNIINIIDEEKNNYFVDLYNLYIDIQQGDKYFTMTDEEIKSILSIDTKDKFSFFHYALTIFSTIWNGDKKYGCNTIDDLIGMCEISKPSAINYNSLLEEKGLLYIKRNNFASRKKDGTISNQANTYCRYSDKYKIDSASKEHGARMFDKTKELDSNTKRRIRANYNSFVKGTYKGNIQSLYDDVLKYNADYNTTVGNKQLDITIFPEEKEEKVDKIVQQLSKTVVKRERYFEVKEEDIFSFDDDPFGLEEENLITEMPSMEDFKDVADIFDIDAFDLDESEVDTKIDMDEIEKMLPDYKYSNDNSFLDDFIF